MYSDHLVPVANLGVVATTFQHNRANTGALLLETERAKKLQIEEEVKTLSASISQNAEEFKKTITNSETKKLYDDFQTARTDWKDVRARIMNLSVAGNKDEANELFINEGSLKSAAEDRALEKLIQQNLTEARQVMETNNKAAQRAIKKTLIIGVVGMLFVLSLGILITRSITQVLGGEPYYAAHIVRKISMGDLTVDVEVKGAHNSSLLAAIKTMAENLRAMVDKISDTSDQVASAARQICTSSLQMTESAHSQSSASEETSATMMQMAASIQAVAQNANALASNVKEVSSAVLELGASSEQVARNAEIMTSSVTETSTTVEQMVFSSEQVAGNSQNLRQIANETSAVVEQMAGSINQTTGKVSEASAVAKAAANEGLAGQRAIQEALAAMKRVADVSEKTAAAIIEVGKRSKVIGSIINIINGLSDQSKLLALNATIEAAKAGDYGRGFAVVAQEMRNLAKRSAKATEEIGLVIKQVQADTDESVKFGELASKEARASMVLSGYAGNALANIVKSIETTSGMMSDIARMSSEQAYASKQVMSAVDKMNKSTEMVANAAKDQSLGGRQILTEVDRMNIAIQEVTVATCEQAKSARQIGSAITVINSMTQQVANITYEQKKGVDIVVLEMENTINIVRENLSY